MEQVNGSREEWSELVRGDAADGSMYVDRRIFTDPAIFDAEVQELFENGWVFLAHISQLANPGDYITTHIGRQPVIVCRALNGQIQAFFNSCRHRGAAVCHSTRGNAKNFRCSYHGWIYGLDGACLSISDYDTGAYDTNFGDQSVNLKSLPQLESYGGFIFGSVKHTGLTLEQYLGDAARFLDLVNGQGENGLEVIDGTSTYIYEGNWKLQLENCADSYHLLYAHQSFMDIVAKRKTSAATSRSTNQLDFGDMRKQRPRCGSFIFEHGHALVWQDVAGMDVRIHEGERDRLISRYGDVYAKWLFYTRNLTIFPNVQVVDNAAIQLRILRPLTANRTEMRIFCLAPKGENMEARNLRLRRYEDFYNASGLATPDDNRCYEDCQAGYQASAISEPQCYARGAAQVIRGADDNALELNINPIASVSGDFVQDEMVLKSSYIAWRSRLSKECRSPAISYRSDQ